MVGRSPVYSDDRRVTGDWVEQYADIVAQPVLPDRWPWAIAIDELEIRLLDFRPDGSRVQRGSDAYTIMAVVGYENADARGRLWRLCARPSSSEADWATVFDELPGNPVVLVMDGAHGGRKAAEARWENLRSYRCAWHLEERARRWLRRAGHKTNASVLWRLLARQTAEGKRPCDIFLDPWAYLTFRLALREARQAEPNNAELATLQAQLDKERTDIWRVLTEPHQPLTIATVEETLDQVRRLLGDRARLFENLPRLNCLLKLVHLHLLRLDDPTVYARLLRDNHQAHHGSPPPRRKHDGAGLAFAA